MRSGKRLEKRNMVPGNTPFIGATESGNGVTEFIGNDNDSRDSNTLGVNYNGSPGIAFYHPYSCLFSDDVKHLHLRHYTDGKEILLGFATLFRMQSASFSYGYKLNGRRMGSMQIMVPVDEEGAPCYDWMGESVRERDAAARRIHLVHPSASRGVCIAHESRMSAECFRPRMGGFLCRRPLFSDQTW